jgi:hypothetical protein
MASKATMINELSYVAAVLNRKIVIKCNNKKKFLFLKNIGAKRRFGLGTKWYLTYKTHLDLAEQFTKLRDEGFFFSYDQHGWGPSDIIQHLKENKFVKGSFTEIFWREPNKIETRKI